MERSFFPTTHPLHALERARSSSIRDALCDYDISFIWNTSAFDPRRKGIRMSRDEIDGPGADLLMPLSAAYVAKPGSNGVYLPAAMDRGAVRYLQDAGFLGDVLYVKNLANILDRSTVRRRRVYAVDDYGVEFDNHTANSQRSMEIVNSKEWVSRLTHFAAAEVRKEIDEVTDDDFLFAHRPGKKVFLKTCNTENAGVGVHPVATIEEFRAAVGAIRALTERYALNHTFVIQPEVSGTNFCFQVFLRHDPESRLEVVSVARQFIGADGKSYAGSRTVEITTALLERIGPAIVDLVAGIRSLCPTAVGFVMCDYLESDDGRVTLIDPGLRPAASTPAALVNLWIQEEVGQQVAVTNGVRLRLGAPNVPFECVAAHLGHYCDPRTILAERYGVLPWGYNHLQGELVAMVITPTPADFDTFHDEIRARLRPVSRIADA